MQTDRAAADGEGPQDCKSAVQTDRAATADGEDPRDYGKSAVLTDLTAAVAEGPHDCNSAV